MRVPLKYFLCIALVFGFVKANAQDGGLYTYQQLSKTYYARQKDSLKDAWKCPDVFDTRAAQKIYREMWDSRTAFITQAIDDQNYVYEPEVFNYVQGIINQLAQASPDMFVNKPFLLIDRSSSANAYAIGGNVIAVNLGLIDFSQCREELALAIAHELSHNILGHIDNVMKERAEWLSSDEYKKSLNAVLDSKYDRFTRLKKLLEGYSFSRSRHQRYHESDADSLAIILLKNAGIAFDAKFFLRLDSSDLQYKQPLAHDLKDYFTAYSLPFEDTWAQSKAHGLSTRNYSFRDTSTIDDSLKTHPDCPARYAATATLSTATYTPTPIPAGVRAKVAKMVIWNIYDNMSLAACLYRVLLEKDKGNTDAWYDFMMHNIFAGLCYNDRRLQRFIAIGVTPKEFISKDYYAMQNMLQQIPRESLTQYCTMLQSAGFWDNRPQDERAMRGFMYTLAIQPDESDRVKWDASASFIDNNSTSPYCEFADHFKKK